MQLIHTQWKKEMTRVDGLAPSQQEAESKSSTFIVKRGHIEDFDQHLYIYGDALDILDNERL